MFRIDVMLTVAMIAAIFFLTNGCDIKPSPQSDPNATRTATKELGDSKMSVLPHDIGKALLRL